MIFTNNNFGSTIINQMGSGKHQFVMRNGKIKTIEGPLRNVVINDKGTFIDGIPLEDYEKGKDTRIVIKVVVEGPVDTIEGADEITVNGNVHKVKTHNGNVTCGDVTGDVTTHNGSVRCGKVGGDVETHNGSIYHQ